MHRALLDTSYCSSFNEHGMLRRRGTQVGGGTQGPGPAEKSLAQQSIPVSGPSTSLLDPPKASPLPLAPASLLVLELIKTLSRLRFASLKAGSCPRHCPEKSGAQLFPSTPSFPLPWRGQAHRCTPGLHSPPEGTSQAPSLTLALRSPHPLSKGWLKYMVSTNNP